ncbi:MAG: hypothetical protein GKR99_03365 [Rhodobacteraceae bacterium]|nr:hypothetical protein [Paracoccaceae bacterium]
MLRTAQEVVIAIFDPVMTEYADGEDPGADVARWLSHHGCKVLVQQLPSGGKDIGEAMILRAREVGADLIVMGAYGRSRLRQNILGGTTTRLIDQSDLPGFMAH